MQFQIDESQGAAPPLRLILCGEVGMWKSSTLALAPRALWLDFHGGLARVRTKWPARAWNPFRPERPENFADFMDAQAQLAKDAAARRQRSDWLLYDGLDYIDRLFIRPEALRCHPKCKSLSDEFNKPYDTVLDLHQKVLQSFETLYYAGFSLGFTCHTQNIERVSSEGHNYMVTDLDVSYVAGKTGKWDCPSIWRDWVDGVVYLTTESRRVVKGEKDRTGKAQDVKSAQEARAAGAEETHLAYLRPTSWLEAKCGRMERLPSPMRFSSPQDLWSALHDGWRDSFASLDDLRAQALRLGEEKVPAKNLEMFRQAVADAPDSDAVLQILRSLQ